jgi:Skp family chaperone for outer membrane proteins
MLMNKKKLSVVFASLFFIAGFVGAIELSMSENLGEIGTVGFVDIGEVFSKFPETQEAKRQFKSELKKEEEKINERKSEIFSFK